MKKTININIGGVIFHVDEDAYQVLQNYLTKINNHFVPLEGGNEIISDIKNRIAEILQSKLNEQKQVVNKEDVEEVVEIMGHPEDFESEGEEKTEQKQYHYERTGRRLYRDPDNRVLGGVCSGIASYFNIDPLIIRILFLIFLFGFGIIVIIYIVLWALLPAANTTAQKFEMRGGNVSISDIEKNVRKEYENVKDNFRNIKNTEGYNHTKKAVSGFSQAIGAFFRFIFRFIMATIGLALIIAGVGFLIGLTGTLIIGEPFMPWNNIFMDGHLVFSDMVHSFIDPNTLWIIVLCAVLVAFIPLVAIIYGGFKLLLGIKPRDKSFAGIGFLVWIVSLITLIVLVGMQIKKYSISVKDTNEIVVENTKHKTLYLKAEKQEDISNTTFYIFDGEIEILYNKNDEEQLYTYPEIDIVRGKTENIVIEIEKEGRGSNRYEARDNLDDLVYNVEIKDSIICFDAVYSVINNHKWTFPEIDVVVKVPENYILFIDESLKEQLDYVYTDTHYWRSDFFDNYWIMTDDGLKEYKSKVE